MPNQKHPGIVREDLFGGVGRVRVQTPLAGESGPFTAVLACELAPAASVGPHVQEEFPELVLGCAGSGLATVDGVPHLLDPGDAVYLPLGSVLALDNRSDELPLTYFIVKARS
jgi:quercetin dioxygenase-like cupin family protein